MKKRIWNRVIAALMTVSLIMAMAPMAFAAPPADISYGDFSITASSSSLRIGNDATVTFTATMTMSPALAFYVSGLTDDTDYDELEFAAHLSIEPGINATVKNIELDSDIFDIDDPNGVFSDSSISEENSSIEIPCKLQDNWRVTDSNSFQSLVDKLRAPMKFTGTVEVLGTELTRIYNAGSSSVTLTGWTTINGVPQSNKIETEKATCTISLTSGGSSRPNVTTGGVNEDGTPATETTAKPGSQVTDDSAKASVSQQMGDEIVRQAENNGSDLVNVEVNVPEDVTETEVTIPGRTVSSLSDRTDADLQVKTSVAEVTIPNEGLADFGGGDLSVNAKRGENGVEVSVTVDGQRVDSVSGGLKVKAPYEDCGPSTVAVVVHEDGTRTLLRDSVADPESGMVRAMVDGSVTLEFVDNSKTFEDVSDSDWFSDAVDFAASHELMNGAAYETFSPNTAMTRGMAAQILYNLEYNPDAGVPEFDDTAEGRWYTDAVTWAAESKVVNGYDAHHYAPNDIVTREQLAAVLYRYAQYKGYDVSAQADLGEFNDQGQVGSWALPAVRWAHEVGLLKGIGAHTLSPKTGATRAQVATVMMRFCEYMEDWHK